MPDSLPVVPGHRFAYDIDGTYVSRTPQWGGTFTALDPAVINDEDNDYHEFFGYRVAGGIWVEVAFAFPEPRDLLGYYIRWGGSDNASNRIYTSVDTTDGSNGTWVNQQEWDQPVGGIYQGGGSAQALTPYYRTNILTCNYAGIRGVRFRFTEPSDWWTGRLWNLHLYGYVSPTQSLDRLEYWDPTINQQAAKDALNFGDTVQGSTYTKQIRVKNLSNSKTASNVVMSADNAAGGGTELATAIQFSLDNTTYAPTLDIGNLTPGQVSPIVYVRRVVGLSEPPAIRSARVIATPATFA